MRTTSSAIKKTLAGATEEKELKARLKKQAFIDDLLRNFKKEARALTNIRVRQSTTQKAKRSPMKKTESKCGTPTKQLDLKRSAVANTPDKI